MDIVLQEHQSAPSQGRLKPYLVRSEGEFVESQQKAEQGPLGKRRSKKERTQFGRRKEWRKVNRRRKRKESCRSELLVISGGNSQRELLESRGSAPGGNQDHRQWGGEKAQGRWLEREKVDPKARSAGMKIRLWPRRPKGGREYGWGRWRRQRGERSGRRWWRRRKDDRENVWGRQSRPKDGMTSPLEGLEVVKGEIARSNQVSCPEKGGFPSQWLKW